ncbi:MAG: hypothetical protein ACLTTZ_00465 [Lachnospiraceae bacterium]
MKLLTNPFGKIIQTNNYNKELDAVYMPVLSSRNLPVTDLKWLLQYAKEVVLLYSDKCADWSYNLNQRIRIEMVNKTSFYEKYMKRNENRNPSIKYRPDFDIPLKRSYALFDAQNNGYENILFLDDDILMTEKNMRYGLSGLTNQKSIVGFHVTDYPDVSTIDHIERIITNCTNTISMTGSCMFCNVRKIDGDFPLLYNEDLFFFMKQKNPNDIISGGTVIQREYYPWLSYDRIRHEQFGDIIYEAIKRRFLNPLLGRIDWNEEIQLRLERIERLQCCTFQDHFTYALQAAYNGTKDIKKSALERFLYDYQFEEWVSIYL